MFRLAEGNAGNDGAQIHVDDVVERHQALDLAEGEPDEIGVFLKPLFKQKNLLKKL